MFERPYPAHAGRRVPRRQVHRRGLWAQGGVLGHCALERLPPERGAHEEPPSEGEHAQVQIERVELIQARIGRVALRADQVEQSIARARRTVTVPEPDTE